MESKKIYLAIALVVALVVAGLFHLRQRREAALLEAKYAPNQIKIDFNTSGSGGEASKPSAAASTSVITPPSPSAAAHE